MKKCEWTLGLKKKIQSLEVKDIREWRDKGKHRVYAQRNQGQTKEREYVCFRILVEKGAERETQTRDGEG